MTQTLGFMEYILTKGDDIVHIRNNGTRFRLYENRHLRTIFWKEESLDALVKAYEDLGFKLDMMCSEDMFIQSCMCWQRGLE